MNILKTVTTTTGNQAMNDEISDLLAEQRQTIELLKKLRNTLDLMDKSNQVITYKLEKVLGDRDFQTAMESIKTYSKIMDAKKDLTVYGKKF